MTRLFSFLFLILCLSFHSVELLSQFKLPFGDNKIAELSNKPYIPDPGADAIIISDIGIASLNYSGEFYVELERNVRVRIVNNNGLDYADIEIPYASDDILVAYKASTFNPGGEEKIETKIDKKSFIRERVSIKGSVLKFNFPDVHEGSVIEYSYIIRYKDNAVYTLVPWSFQSDIPTITSSLTIAYPEACVYKNTISGSSKLVNLKSTISTGSVFGRVDNVINSTWYTQNMPAFRDEPFSKSEEENMTSISFELASINFPGSSFEEITPTYASLTKKLLERDDFGKPLKTNLGSIAQEITKEQKDDLSRIKKLHEYITANILWDGVKDFTTSAPLRTILKKQKGNSADLNILLIAMLRSLGIKADPVILSTRSNGSINMFSAMIQQFNYVLAYVSINGDMYLVDATDPLQPFDLLPFDCLNNKGRLISEYEAKFVDLKNNEKQTSSHNLNLSIEKDGGIKGTLENRYSAYSALNRRKQIKLESEEGYIDAMRLLSSNLSLTDYEIDNVNEIYSDLIEKCKADISIEVQIARNEILFNPFISTSASENPFISTDRRFPVDFGCPISESYTVSLKIPEGYIVTEKPADILFNLGQTDGKFELSCRLEGNKILLTTVLNINKTVFQPSEYPVLRNFYTRVLQKQAELIVLKKI